VLQAYLRSLLGPRNSGQLVEIRFRRGARMSQCFFGRTEVVQAAQVILALGERTDVYVGAAPRTRAAGGKDAVRELWAVWADCDDEEARERLWDFRPAPSIVVATGSPHGCHAYWLLKRPLVPAAGEPANRRLAHALGADPRAVDAARILRPPGTFSFKRRPPVAVRLERFVPQRYDAHCVVGALPAPPERPSGTAHRRANGADPLRSIPPAQYVEALLGVSVGRDRKVRCPFHESSPRTWCKSEA